MKGTRHYHPSTRHSHAEDTPPLTWGSIALIAGFAAAIPLTLFALAHPAVVAAAVAGLAAGLTARPLRLALARRSPAGRERSADAVGPAAAGE